MLTSAKPSSLTCQISRHFWENFRDQDRHFVLHTAFDGNPEAPGLSGLVDDHLAPAGRHVVRDGDIGVALTGDDVDVIVQGDPQVETFQSDAAIICDEIGRRGTKYKEVLPALVPVGLYQQVQHSNLSRTSKSPLCPVSSKCFSVQLKFYLGSPDSHYKFTVDHCDVVTA